MTFGKCTQYISRGKNDDAHLVYVFETYRGDTLKDNRHNQSWKKVEIGLEIACVGCWLRHLQFHLRCGPLVLLKTSFQIVEVEGQTPASVLSNYLGPLVIFI